MKTIIRAAVLSLFLFSGQTRAAVQYWDPDPAAGYQAGSGAWSYTNLNWGVAATGPRSAWTNGNDAYVEGSGPSVIVMDGLVTTAGYVRIRTSGGAVVVTNGAQVQIAANMHTFVGEYSLSSGDALVIAGGVNGPTRWNMGASAAVYLGGSSSTTNASGHAFEVDGAGVSGGAAFSNAAAFYMGYATGCNSNRVTIRNGGSAVFGGDFLAGNVAQAYANAVRVDSGTLRVIGRLLMQGADGRMTVTNGGLLRTAGASHVIGNAGAGNQVVLAPGCTWDCAPATAIILGNVAGGSNNAFLVDGGLVTNAGYVTVGNNVAAPSNEVAVVNGGRIILGGNTSIGSSGSYGNRIRLEGPAGAQWNAGNAGLTLGSGSTSVDNSLLVDGKGAVEGASFINVNQFKAGLNASFNRVIVTNGGYLSVKGGDLYVGQNGSTNRLEVTGGAADSKIDAFNQSLFVGSGPSVSNRVLIDGAGAAGGAVVSNINTLRIGYSTGGGVIYTGAFNAVVVTNGGRLYLSTGGAAIGSGSAYIFVGLSNRLDIASDGQVFSAGPFYVGAAGYSSAYQGTQIGNRLNVDGLLDLGGSGLTIGYFNGGGYTGYVTDNRAVVKGVVTNAGVVRVSDGAGGGYPTVLLGNRLEILDGGRLYSRGASAVPMIPTTGNSVRVSGAGSLWDLGGFALTVGTGGNGTNNSLELDGGGRVDAIGALTVYPTNAILLKGGTLVATSAVYYSDSLVIGDGVQPATLKGLGGNLMFTNGLVVTNNGTLAGVGQINGSVSGIALLAGGTLSPGLDGIGTLTIGGSNLTWNPDGVYRCEITDLAAGPGVGWDLVNVAAQLQMNGTGLKVAMDSRGGAAANFDAGRDYTLRILSYGTNSGYAPSSVTVDATAFANGGTWTVTNGANALWLVYRGAGSPAAATYTWAAPNTGVWSEPTNWAGGVAPTAGGNPDWILAFPDAGVRYTASNNLAGAFQLKGLRLSSASSVTNVLSGGQLAFTNAGATIDYAAGETGTFVISNAVRLTTDAELGGNAMGGTVVFAGSLTNLGTLTRRGTWTMALVNANNFFKGPFVMDDGAARVRLDALTAFNGSGPLVISNGLITTYKTTATLTFSGAPNGRTALIKGPGAVWSNQCYISFFSKETNALLVVDRGYLSADNVNSFFLAGSRDGRFVVTNGGMVYNNANDSYVGHASTNCEMILTGTNSMMYCNQYFGAAASGGMSNRVIVEKGALLTGGNNFGLIVGGLSNSLLIRAGGRATMNSVTTGLSVRGSNNTAVVTGSGSTVLNSGNAAVSIIGLWPDYGNTLTIDDGGLVSNVTIQVGAAGACSNSLRIAGGGRFIHYTSADGAVAAGPSNAFANSLVVTGSYSVYNGGGRALTVCAGTGMLNRLAVEDGALVTNVTTLLVAAGTAASNNTASVRGGQLQCRILTSAGESPNRFEMSGSAVVTPAFLYVSNAPFSFAFAGGVLNVKTALVNNGSAFVAGDGTQSAELRLQAASRGEFTAGLVVTSAAVLAGSGLIVAPTSTVFGTLSPGAAAAVGSLTNQGDLALQAGAVSRMKIASLSSWDLLTVTNGNLALGGTMRPVLTGGYLPPREARFLVMTNVTGTVTGSFGGGRATIYDEAGVTRLGTFLVDIGSQGVVLTDYREWRSNGVLIMVQ